MTREVSRRTSGPSEWKGAVRPDVVGLKDLDPNIVEDRPDITRMAAPGKVIGNILDGNRGPAMDAYLKTLDNSEGPSKQQGDGVKPMPQVLKGRVPNG